MNMIEQLFNDFGAKYLEEAKKKGVNLGLQNIFTPIDKIEKATNFRFADHITSETRSVAVLFNTEFIGYFIKELPQNYINNIKFTFFYDCEFDYKQVRNFIFFSGKKLKIDLVKIENIKDLDKIMSGKKFDIVFSNPPYGTSNSNALDLIILKSCFSIANKIIFIHPSEWFLNKYSKKQIKSELKNSSKLEKISLIWGNSIFNIGIFMPLCISEWNTCKKTNFVKINDFAFSKKSFECLSADFDIHYGNVKDFYKEYADLITKLKSHDSIYLHRVNADLSNLTDYSVKIANIRGNMSTNGFSSDFFTYIGLNEKKINYTDKTYTVKRNRDDERKCWSFNNEDSRKNFVSYMKTKIVRFGNSLAKTGQGPTYEFIPWMDFTQEWNDAKLCKEFGISEELWNYIDKFIPDYYDDYKSGF